jgi:hypothetical protein
MNGAPSIQTRTIASRVVDSRASREWARRPDDERFLTLDSLAAHVNARRDASRERGVALEQCRVYDAEDGTLHLQSPEHNYSDGRGKALGFDAGLTHWSMGQLCSALSRHTGDTVPASYLRTLPPTMAAMNLQWHLQHASKADGKALVTRIPEGYDVRSLTSDSYGRIWDADLVAAIQALDRAQPGTWKIPAASYQAHDQKRATTLYASDRDVFVFLVDSDHPITVPGRSEPMFRGFYAWNSEVGAGKAGLATFFYDVVCDNRNIWGQRDFKEISLIHRSMAPQRFASEIKPALANFANSSAAGTAGLIQRAQVKEVGRDRASVLKWLRDEGFGKAVAESAYTAAESADLNPRSLWGIQWGLTAEARNIAHTDDRIALEKQAGRLMDLV